MLGKKLRDLRGEAGFTALEVARKLEISTGRLSRIENGEVAPDIPLAKYLLDLYGIPVNDWEPWLEEIRAARKTKGWWQAYGVAARGYVALETAAISVTTFEIAHMPGLLQTEEYMRAFFGLRHSDERNIQNQVQVRLIRQRRLHADEDRLELRCVIDEAVLHRQVGSSPIMKRQLGHIVNVGQFPNVTVQVVPRDRRPYVGMDGAFAVLGFLGEPDLAYVENVAGSFQVEKEDQVRACRLAFDEIRSVALDPAASAALIRSLERVGEEVPMWRKSSFSTNNGNDGNCVEVAVAPTVLVRDSKNATGPHLRIPATEWRSFVGTVGGRTGTPG